MANTAISRKEPCRSIPTNLIASVSDVNSTPSCYHIPPMHLDTLDTIILMPPLAMPLENLRQITDALTQELSILP